MNRKKSNQDTPERTIDKIGFTVVKGYKNIRSINQIGLHSSVKLTNKAIYTRLMGIFPVGKVLLEDIIEFRLIKKEWVGVMLFLNGIVVKYKEKGKIRESIFFIRENRIDSFTNNLRKLGIKEKKE